jgi:hypothetical protein
MHIPCHRTAIPCHVKVKEQFKSKRVKRLFNSKKVKSSGIVGGYGIPAIPTQSAVHAYCQCDCHHSIGLYTHVCVGMAGMPYPPTDTHSSVFKKPVLLFFCLFKNNMFSCPHVLKKTCSLVLMSSKQQHVLMFSCLSKTTCSSVFPQKEPCSPVQLCLYVAKKNG